MSAARTTQTPQATQTPRASGTTQNTETGARAEDAADAITDARRRIDDLDARIIALVRDRVETSARVQHARIASGGRRVSLSREMEILARYRDELGRPGTALAMTLLELSRGGV